MTAVPHLGFIVAAYAATVVTLVTTVVVLVRDQRTQRRLLDRIAPRGDE